MRQVVNAVIGFHDETGGRRDIRVVLKAKDVDALTGHALRIQKPLAVDGADARRRNAVFVTGFHFHDVARIVGIFHAVGGVAFELPFRTGSRFGKIHRVAFLRRINIQRIGRGIDIGVVHEDITFEEKVHYPLAFGVFLEAANRGRAFALADKKTAFCVHADTGQVPQFERMINAGRVAASWISRRIDASRNRITGCVSRTDTAFHAESSDQTRHAGFAADIEKQDLFARPVVGDEKLVVVGFGQTRRLADRGDGVRAFDDLAFDEPALAFDRYFAAIDFFVFIAQHFAVLINAEKAAMLVPPAFGVDGAVGLHHHLVDVILHPRRVGVVRLAAFAKGVADP